VEGSSGDSVWQWKNLLVVGAVTHTRWQLNTLSGYPLESPSNQPVYHVRHQKVLLGTSASSGKGFCVVFAAVLEVSEKHYWFWLTQ